MTENTDAVNINKFDGKGALWTIAGTAIAGVATQWLNGIHGGGGFGLGGNAVAQAANTTVAYEMAKKDTEIAQLKADAATDKKLVDVYTTLRALDKAQDEKISSLNTRVTAIETASPLREQIVLGKVDAVATLAQNGIATNSAAIAGLAATVGAITKTVVPKDACCPEYMMRYNSFTVPTTPTNSGAAAA